MKVTKPLSKSELKEIKSYMERLFVGRNNADRFFVLLDRLTENINQPKQGN